MAHKLDKGRYACSYCGEIYSDPAACDSHKESHDLIYVPLSRTDLSRLLQFLYLKNDDLLTPSLVKSLNKYLRGNR